MTIDELDMKEFIYGKGHPSHGNWQHISTQGELKKRLELNGSNEKITAQFCIVLIYQYWNYYRSKVESRLGMEKNDIKSDIMGDIRWLRNAILKNKGLGNHEMKRCKILNWFKENEEINISNDRFEEIIKIIKTRLLHFS